MRKSLSLSILFILVTFFAAGCGPIKKLIGGSAQEIPLTIADIEPKLAAFGGASFGFSDDSEEGLVTYVQIGDPAYDDFFKASAKLNGLVLLCKGMTTTATGQLKKFAQSKAADAALAENIKELVGDTPKEEWTTEQSIAVMKMSRMQGKMDLEEGKYFATTAGSIGVAVIALGKGVGEAKDLLPKGADLLNNVSSLKPMMVPAATKGVKGSIDNLKSVVDNTPKMLEEMNVLISAFGQLNN